MKKIRKIFSVVILLLMLLVCGCHQNKETDKTAKVTTETIQQDTTKVAEQPRRDTTKVAEQPRQDTTEAAEQSSQDTTKAAEQPVQDAAETADSPAYNLQGKLIVIDPGHQGKGNNEPEPVGPGATEKKAKVTTGTAGCVSGLSESELNLAVSLKLKQELANRGYQVLMTRESQDVNLSNAERAQIANQAGASAFVRIHADGAENAATSGASVLCQSPLNPFNGDLYEESRRLSECILNEMTAETGGKKRGITETDTMSGINWCQVPAAIVEMGFMTNPEEDARMATEEYQWKIARGIADGLELYFSK